MKKKNIFKRIVSIVLAFGLLSGMSLQFSTAASAYETWGSNKLVNGVGQSGNYTRGYWMETNTSNSGWQDRVEDAMYAWCHTGSQGCGVYTSVWFIKTAKSSSVMDFYDSSLEEGTLGLTTHYAQAGNYESKVYPWNASSGLNWVWAMIEIDEAQSGVYLTETQKLAMVEHEIGHAFGLAHVNNPAVLMYPYADVCTATRPTADDCYGVNSLYGGYNP